MCVSVLVAASTEDVCIVERLFSSSLVAIVSLKAPRKLKVCHFKKGTEICNYSYSNTILAVKLNRQVSGKLLASMCGLWRCPYDLAPILRHLGTPAMQRAPIAFTRLAALLWAGLAHRQAVTCRLYVNLRAHPQCPFCGLPFLLLSHS